MSLLIAKPDLKAISTAVVGHGYAGDNLNTCISDVAGLPYNFDSLYNSYPGQKKFGLYGDPTASVDNASLSWTYNAHDVKTFTVTCNHSTWKILSGTDITGWVVKIYQADGYTEITGTIGTTLYPSGAIIKVNPIGNNTGVSAKELTLNVTTFNDYMIGPYCYCEQAYNPVLPTFTFQSDDITLSLTSCTYSVGSADITLTWTPSGMGSSPHINYVYITRLGPINVFSGSRGSCYNGVAINTYPVTLSQIVQYGVNYLITIDYSNA
jgi:hypothetical protein